MNKYFALTANEKLVTVEAETSGDALEKEPDDTVWLFDRDTLAQLGEEIAAALNSPTLHGVRLSEPRQDDRTFIVAAAGKGGAYAAVVDQSVGDVCSVTFVELDEIFAERSGRCVEVLG